MTPWASAVDLPIDCVRKLITCKLAKKVITGWPLNWINTFREKPELARGGNSLGIVSNKQKKMSFPEELLEMFVRHIRGI